MMVAVITRGKYLGVKTGKDKSPGPDSDRPSIGNLERDTI